MQLPGLRSRSSPPSGLAVRFWALPVGQERLAAANAFFEHLGMVDGLLLIAGLNLREKRT